MMKFSPVVIIAPLLIGGALWVMAARKKEEEEKPAPGVPGVPSAPSPPTETPPTPPGVPSTPTAAAPPADIGKYVLQAVASGAPDYMRQAAHALEAWGYTDQAADLRKVASQEQAAEAADAEAVQETDKILTRTPGIAQTLPRTETTARPTTLPSGITIPAPTPPAPPAGTEQVELPPIVPVTQPGSTVADPMDVARANLAQRTADHLRTATKYKEDKALVGAFQTQEITQGWTGKADGLYGPGTARRFARYGIVPPNPLYWPRTNPTQAKAEYAAWLLSQAPSQPNPTAWATAAAAVH